MSRRGRTAALGFERRGRPLRWCARAAEASGVRVPGKAVLLAAARRAKPKRFGACGLCSCRSQRASRVGGPITPLPEGGLDPPGACSLCPPSQLDLSQLKRPRTSFTSPLVLAHSQRSPIPPQLGLCVCLCVVLLLLEVDNKLPSTLVEGASSRLIKFPRPAKRTSASVHGARIHQLKSTPCDLRPCVSSHTTLTSVLCAVRRCILDYQPIAPSGLYVFHTSQHTCRRYSSGTTRPQYRFLVGIPLASILAPGSRATILRSILAVPCTKPTHWIEAGVSRLHPRSYPVYVAATVALFIANIYL